MVTFALQRAQGWDRTVWCPLDILTPTGLFCNKSRSIRCFFFFRTLEDFDVFSWPCHVVTSSLTRSGKRKSAYNSSDRRRENQLDQNGGYDPRCRTYRTIYSRGRGITSLTQPGHTDSVWAVWSDYRKTQSRTKQALQSEISLRQQKHSQRSMSRVHIFVQFTYQLFRLKLSGESHEPKNVFEPNFSGFVRRLHWDDISSNNSFITKMTPVVILASFCGCWSTPEK